jgi:hypothetical protein
MLQYPFKSTPPAGLSLLINQRCQSPRGTSHTPRRAPGGRQHACPGTARGGPGSWQRAIPTTLPLGGAPPSWPAENTLLPPGHAGPRAPRAPAPSLAWARMHLPVRGVRLAGGRSRLYNSPHHLECAVQRGEERPGHPGHLGEAVRQSLRPRPGPCRSHHRPVAGPRSVRF